MGRVSRAHRVLISASRYISNYINLYKYHYILTLTNVLLRSILIVALMKRVEEAAFSACDVVFMSLSSSNSFSSQFHPPVMHVERISPFLDSHVNLGQTGQTYLRAAAPAADPGKNPKSNPT